MEMRCWLPDTKHRRSSNIMYDVSVYSKGHMLNNTQEPPQAQRP